MKLTGLKVLYSLFPLIFTNTMSLDLLRMENDIYPVKIVNITLTEDALFFLIQETATAASR